LRSIISKSSLYFQLFFDLNQGSASFKINNFVTIKSFSLKIRPSTAIATLRRLTKVLLILLIDSLSNCVPNIDRVFRRVLNTYFDHPESKRWISTTTQAFFLILLRIDGPFKRQSAARNFAILFVLVVELWFFKLYLGILRYFPPFYWLFKVKFNILVTVGCDHAIFWASTEKANCFVWIPSLYFYSIRLLR